MRYIISGGGTGGHIYPAIAIADRIREADPGAEILFVGSRGGMEMELIPAAGYDISPIDVTYFHRAVSIHNLKGVGLLMLGLIESSRILSAFKPDWVIGTGGYVAGPVVYMAAKKGYKTMIHEQNAFPGLTNRILAKHVDVVALSFDEAKKHLSGFKRAVVTGNPVRKEYYQHNAGEFDEAGSAPDGKKTVLVSGGSGGSEHINRAVINMMEDNEDLPFLIHWSTGKRHYDEIVKRKQLEKQRHRGHRIVPYIDQMPMAIKTSHLVVCSAGAITIAEVEAAGKYSILVPKAYTAENHQEKNAIMMEKEGFATVIREKEIDGKRLMEEITRMLDKAPSSIEITKVRPAVDLIWSLMQEGPMASKKEPFQT